VPCGVDFGGFRFGGGAGASATSAAAAAAAAASAVFTLVCFSACVVVSFNRRRLDVAGLVVGDLHFCGWGGRRGFAQFGLRFYCFCATLP
jgi:hypothetical protein